MFDLQPSATAGRMENTFIDYLVSGITSPVDGTLGPCPRPAIASPSPAGKSAASDVNVLAIALPTALGFLLLLLLAGIVIGCACVLVGKRRRKYFDAADGARDCDPESGIEMSTVKLTFRYSTSLTHSVSSRHLRAYWILSLDCASDDVQGDRWAGSTARETVGRRCIRQGL
jgi:hypothetical protein